MQDNSYEQAWRDGESDAPLSDAVEQAKREQQAAVHTEYAQAYRELDAGDKAGDKGDAGKDGEGEKDKA